MANKSQKYRKSLCESLHFAAEQTTIALSVPGVTDQFVRLCGITPSEVYSLMFWDNAIIKQVLSNTTNAYCPTKKKIDNFQRFIEETWFKKLTPPKFNHKDQKINDKNMLKSLKHKIRYCKMVFLLAQNQFNRYAFLSYHNDTHNDDDDEDTEISYQTTGPLLILQILFDTIHQTLNSFSWVLDTTCYKLTATNEDTEMKENDITSKYSAKVIVHSMELLQWCFCAMFMLSFTVQSKMEIVDFKNGIILQEMIRFFVILKYFIDQNRNNVNLMRCINNIRSIFLVLKKLCKTVPFPSNIFGGPNGAILLVAEILIYCKSLRGMEELDDDDEAELMHDTLMNVYFHGVSVLEFLDKQCDLVKDHLQRYQRTEYQLSHICFNRRMCRNLCFGFQKYYLRFCKECGNDLFRAFGGKIEENGINMFIPDQVSSKEYMNYYVVALKKFCKQKEFRQFDNDVVFNIIVGYLDYQCCVGDSVDFKDELGNWCLFRVKQIHEHKMFQHRIQIGMDYNKKWDQWIDSRSIRVAHPRTYTKATAATRDDML